MDQAGPTYEFVTPCALCSRGEVRVINAYDAPFGDSGTTTIVGGLYCPRCDLCVCSGCAEDHTGRLRCYARSDECPLFPPARVL